MRIKSKYTIKQFSSILKIWFKNFTNILKKYNRLIIIVVTNIILVTVAFFIGYQLGNNVPIKASTSMLKTGSGSISVQLVKVEQTNVRVKDKNNIEYIFSIDAKTKVVDKNNKNIKISDIKIGTNLILYYSPQFSEDERYSIRIRMVD